MWSFFNWTLYGHTPTAYMGNFQGSALTVCLPTCKMTGWNKWALQNSFYQRHFYNVLKRALWPYLILEFTPFPKSLPTLISLITGMYSRNLKTGLHWQFKHEIFLLAINVFSLKTDWWVFSVLCTVMYVFTGLHAQFKHLLSLNYIGHLYHTTHALATIDFYHTKPSSPTGSELLFLTQKYHNCKDSCTSL